MCFGFFVVRQHCRFLLVLLIFLFPFSSTAFAGVSYITTIDNENNAGNGVADGDLDRNVFWFEPAHPIEFNINVVAPLPTTSVYLTLRAFDVDEEAGEIDNVTLNGVALGFLNGANQVWSTSVFVVDPALIKVGANLVQITVGAGFFVKLDWGQLVIDGGPVDKGNIRSFSVIDAVSDPLNAANIQVNTETIIDATAGGDYLFDVSVVDPNGNSASVFEMPFVGLVAGSTVTQPASLTYPLAGVSGMYTLYSQLFHLDAVGNPIEQTIAVRTVVHTSGVGVLDLDGDGLSDLDEVSLGTNPTNQDSDGDTDRDDVEVGNVAAPNDSDGDGRIDALESRLNDADGDGASDQDDAFDADPCAPAGANAACLAFDSDGDTLINSDEDRLTTDRNLVDTDGDGARDDVEVGVVATPNDADNDGKNDAIESSIFDTDGDGAFDQFDPDNVDSCIPSVTAANCDSDADGLGYAEELAINTDPNSNDSDGDGILDGIEVGPVVAVPLDGDGDTIIDALDSNILDADLDGVVDQLDKANLDACIPSAAAASCDADNDGLTNGEE
ncbi:MAG: hypothetical protein Q9N68_00115, partial [Gammaproteobacteria bacterium]|nr:hypothetical protein [Gammaproteobacteria bacterium]